MAHKMKRRSETISALEKSSHDELRKLKPSHSAKYILRCPLVRAE